MLGKMSIALALAAFGGYLDTQSSNKNLSLDTNSVTHIGARRLTKALLQDSYFPNQSASAPEFPPCISTKALKRKDIFTIISEKDMKRRKEGYDATNYGLTKGNHTIRRAQIPHPTPYFHLVKTIEDCWADLDRITINPNSMIRPMLHGDGRLFVIKAYDTDSQGRYKETDLEPQGSRYIVRTDVRNLYPSIYSHSIPWALVGRDTAKVNRQPTQYYNQLDKGYTYCRRGETSGIAIGPGTSNIAAEVVMGAVDEYIQNQHGHSFYRYIDDYIFYSETMEEAESFLQTLTRELGEYHLSINESKTSISPLPVPTNPNWLIQIKLLNISRWDPSRKAHAFLDNAIGLLQKEGDPAVLIYAAKVMLHCIEKTPIWAESILHRLFLLSSHHPRITPLLEPVISKLDGLVGEYSLIIDRNIREAVRFGRSDIATWGLYYLFSAGVSLSRETRQEILITRDCLPTALLFAAEEYPKSDVNDFLVELVQRADQYSIDQFWPILYQLFAAGKLRKIAPDPSFDHMNQFGITFVKV
jgi:hypothetical protein